MSFFNKKTTTNGNIASYFLTKIFAVFLMFGMAVFPAVSFADKKTDGMPAFKFFRERMEGGHYDYDDDDYKYRYEYEYEQDDDYDDYRKYSNKNKYDHDYDKEDEKYEYMFKKDGRDYDDDDEHEYDDEHGPMMGGVKVMPMEVKEGVLKPKPSIAPMGGKKDKDDEDNLSSDIFNPENYITKNKSRREGGGVSFCSEDNLAKLKDRISRASDKVRKDDDSVLEKKLSDVKEKSEEQLAKLDKLVDRLFEAYSDNEYATALIEEFYIKVSGLIEGKADKLSEINSDLDAKLEELLSAGDDLLQSERESYVEKAYAVLDEVVDKCATEEDYIVRRWYVKEMYSLRKNIGEGDNSGIKELKKEFAEFRKEKLAEYREFIKETNSMIRELAKKLRDDLSEL